VLLLTGKVTVPRIKTVKINGNVNVLRNVILNDPFVLNLRNVANGYIFKCLSFIKVKTGGRITGFLDELGPF